MHIDPLKAVFMAAWILAACVLAYVSAPTSVAAWTVLAAVSLTPPLVMLRLWRMPSQSMSESIREVLR